MGGIRWKPWTHQDHGKYEDGRYKTIYYSWNTYREVKQNLKRLIKENQYYPVMVSRSRRGEWGEWFEYWELNNGKLTKTKEGWM